MRRMMMVLAVLLGGCDQGGGACEVPEDRVIEGPMCIDLVDDIKASCDGPDFEACLTEQHDAWLAECSGGGCERCASDMALAMRDCYEANGALTPCRPPADLYDELAGN